MSNQIERVLQITGTHDHTTKKSENRKVEIIKDIKEETIVKEEEIIKFHITEQQ